MFSMALTSAWAFLRGKLFRDNGPAFLLLGAGVSATAVVLVAGVRLGLPLYGAAGLAGLVGGLLQPRLFKNLKYR